MRRVLIVDDEKNVHYSFRRALDGEFAVLSAHDGEEALSLLERQPADAVLLDLKLPRLGGLETLERLRDRHPQLPVVVMTAYADVDTTIRATALAARDYLLKPVDVPALKKLLNEILPETRVAAERGPPTTGEGALVGRSAQMHDLFKLIGRAAASDATVLVTGESGTGKELVARAIHQHSARRTGPFVAINCAAIPENLLESELFGHERGAFTGADRERPGKFELAHRGTLFLDEIGEMAPSLQAKLLRVLQSREVTRLGASAPVRCDVRMVVATNADLGAKIIAGTFREDLYYRLDVFRIHAPPLRERAGDVRLLAQHFLSRERQHLRRPVSGFTPEAEERLEAHAWPGNVRELENVIAQACLKARGDAIGVEDLALRPIAFRRDGRSGIDDPTLVLNEAVSVFLQAFPGQSWERCERLIVERALSACRGNQVHAARLLGVTRNVLRKRMERHSLGGLGEKGETTAVVEAD